MHRRERWLARQIHVLERLAEQADASRSIARPRWIVKLSSTCCTTPSRSKQRWNALSARNSARRASRGSMPPSPTSSLLARRRSARPLTKLELEPRQRQRRHGFGGDLLLDPAATVVGWALLFAEVAGRGRTRDVLGRRHRDFADSGSSGRPTSAGASGLGCAGGRDGALHATRTTSSARTKQGCIDVERGCFELERCRCRMSRNAAKPRVARRLLYVWSQLKEASDVHPRFTVRFLVFAVRSRRPVRTRPPAATPRASK